MSAPAIYNPAAVWPVIFEAISNGASLTEAMRQPNMPSLAWAKRQLQHDPDLQRAYQAAIVERAQALADQIVQLSDSQPPPDLEGAAHSVCLNSVCLGMTPCTVSTLCPARGPRAGALRGGAVSCRRRGCWRRSRSSGARTSGVCGRSRAAK